MKLLLVLAAIALLIWLLRGGRNRVSRDAPPRTQRRVAAPEPMVACDWCGLHLPAADALPVPDGRHFCSADHRRRAAG